MLRSFMSLRSSESRLVVSTVSMSAVTLLYRAVQKNGVVVASDVRPQVLSPLSLSVIFEAPGVSDGPLDLAVKMARDRMQDMSAGG